MSLFDVFQIEIVLLSNIIKLQIRFIISEHKLEVNIYKFHSSEILEFCSSKFKEFGVKKLKRFKARI
jgi:hypothetical protein